MSRSTSSPFTASDTSWCDNRSDETRAGRASRPPFVSQTQPGLVLPRALLYWVAEMKLILVLLLTGLSAGCSQKPDSQPLTRPPSAQDSADGSSKSSPAADSVGAAPSEPSAAPVVAPQTTEPQELAV